jgi:hypothetical protein
VAEFMGQRPVPRGQPLLDQEHIMIAVLPPLAAHTRWQFLHLDFDAATAVVGDSMHKPQHGDLSMSGCHVEHR